MKAKKRIKGHRWFHSGGGCSCGAVHDEESPVTETERQDAKILKLGVGAVIVPEPADPMDAERPPATRVSKYGRVRKTYRSEWMAEMRAMPCHYCGGPGGTLDHVLPASKGGKTTLKNCVPACAPCNNFRDVQPYREFKEYGWKSRPFAISRGDHVQAR